MAGYVRQDTTNNIADGNIINAVDLDNEYNALEAAFNASTGHTHDGTSAEGAPITKVGPTQDVVVSATAVTPKTDNTVDLGSALLEFKDLYIDGTANIDSLVADTADINGGTIDGTIIGGASAAAGSFTTLAASGNSTIGGTLGVTGLITATGGVSGAVTSSNVTVTGGSINGTTIGGTTAAAGSFTTLSASSTATLNTLSSSGATITGGTINNTSIGATTASTGAFTNLSYTGTLTGGTGVVNIGSGQFYKDASGNVGIGTSSPSRTSGGVELVEQQLTV
jgi:hypothetical protein